MPVRFRQRRAFTLLEVLVAIAILGLGLSVILSSQVGLFGSARQSEHITVATNLLRCKMSEVEVDLVKEGFPFIDRTDSGDCCDGEDTPGYTCDWKIERVKLPEPSLTGESDGGMGGPADALGQVAALAQSAQANPGEAPDMASLTSQLGDMGGGQGPAGMAFGLVYPTLQPILEASIRKVTVTVKWKQGKTDGTLSVTQYVTNPQQGATGAGGAQGAGGGN
jgi:general secretion pathway protein I